jgi:hypothetical protein
MGDSSSPLTQQIILSFAAIMALLWFGSCGIAFNLFDTFRGSRDDRLQAVFRELLVPGAGGYAAMATARFFAKGANSRVVFFGFSAIVLILVSVYIGLVAPVAGKIGTNVWGMLLAVLSLVAAIAGAYVHTKRGKAWR